MKGFSLCLLPFHKLKWIVSLPTRRRQELPVREKKSKLEVNWESSLSFFLFLFTSLTLVLICLMRIISFTFLLCTFGPEVLPVNRVPSESNEGLYDVRYRQWSPTWTSTLVHWCIERINDYTVMVKGISDGNSLSFTISISHILIDLTCFFLILSNRV